MASDPLVDLGCRCVGYWSTESPWFVGIPTRGNDQNSMLGSSHLDSVVDVDCVSARRFISRGTSRFMAVSALSRIAPRCSTQISKVDRETLGCTIGACVVGAAIGGGDLPSRIDAGLGSYSPSLGLPRIDSLLQCLVTHTCIRPLPVAPGLGSWLYELRSTPQWLIRNCLFPPSWFSSHPFRSCLRPLHLCSAI